VVMIIVLIGVILRLRMIISVNLTGKFGIGEVQEIIHLKLLQ